ncbi:MAG: flagellar hook-length control protein FliK [Pseudomonadota bacterium]
MLPLSLLPTTESGTFLDGLDAGVSPESAGAGSDALQTAFADLLGQNGASAAVEDVAAGETLPLTGKLLPPAAETVGGAATPGPEEIVASLEEQIDRLILSENAAAEPGGRAARLAELRSADELKANEILNTLVPPDMDHAGPVDERPQAQVLQTVDSGLARAAIAAGSPDDRAASAPGIAAGAPVVTREQASATRDLPRAMAAAASAGATDSGATTAPPTPAGIDEPVTLNVDSRAADARASAQPGLLLPTATPTPGEAGIESLGAVRPGAADIAAVSTPRSGPAAVSLPPIDVPVQDPAWDQAVSERVVMMAANKLKVAEIRLTPAELGPLRIQVAVDDGAAQVSFVAQHTVTRDALEQALPRLRDMFAESGIQLGDARVDVDTADTREERAGRDAALSPGQTSAADADIDAEPAAAAPIRQQRGLVDTFV